MTKKHLIAKQTTQTDGNDGAELKKKKVTTLEKSDLLS
jgi:hypothetical protein